MTDVSIGLSARRDGGTLRTRLLLLVLVPLLGMTAFAAFEIHTRASSAAHARRVDALVRSIGRVSRAQDAVLSELTPSMATVIMTAPSLASELGLSGLKLSALGIDNTQLARLRGATDRAVAQLAGDARTAKLAGDARKTMSDVRTEIGSVTGLPKGFDQATALSRRLAAAQAEFVTKAFETGLDTQAALAVRDLSRVTQLETYAELETAELAGAAYPDLFSNGDSGAAVQDWLRVWGGLDAVRQELLVHGAPQLAHALRTALDTTAARTFDIDAARVAESPGPIASEELITLYRSSTERDKALYQVLTLALRRVQDSARAQSRNADLALWSIAAVLLAVALGSALVAWLILRSVSRPLRRLADSARKVSEGVLEEVRVDGPHEVRTAARGLAAAVANLRNIEAQAAAVAAGELHSDVVRRPLPGPLGEVVHASVQTIVGAIHERDAAQADLAHQAAHDSLTALTNRAHAMALIESSLQRAREKGTVTALMFVDLDHFKTVNDTLGHEAGDAVLVACARRMTRVVRSSDTVARLGGDEFVILLEGVTSGADVAGLAQRLVARLAEPIRLGHRQLHVSASVGVAVCTDANVDAERLLGEADAAAYQAKKEGRGRFSLFDDELRAELARHTEIEHAIAAGLAAGEFVLHYQPVVDLRTGRAEGVEALIRWEHPEQGLLSPADFIPIAESSTLINDIGRWTLMEATAQLASWNTELGERRLTMAVNISGRHLASDTLIDDIRRALDASGIDPAQLIIELTETVLVEHVTASGNLLKLRELGIKVAIDDFGTGFTSIGQLLRLPLDVLKIDRSFIASQDPTHHELVHLMARAAHAFGLRVVAEGVEEPAQLTALSRCAVDSAQGYLYARPQVAAEALAFIRLPNLSAEILAFTA